MPSSYFPNKFEMNLLFDSYFLRTKLRTIITNLILRTLQKRTVDVDHEMQKYLFFNFSLLETMQLISRRMRRNPASVYKVNNPIPLAQAISRLKPRSTPEILVYFPEFAKTTTPVTNPRLKHPYRGRKRFKVNSLAQERTDRQSRVPFDGRTRKTRNMLKHNAFLNDGLVT